MGSQIGDALPKDQVMIRRNFQPRPWPTGTGEGPETEFTTHYAYRMKLL